MAERTFISSPAVRTRVPLIVSIASPSGGGKTKSALELATGMQQVFGGDINVADVENRRALHYADQYRFNHTPFEAPYGSDDYSQLLTHMRRTKPGVVIVDQLSWEHDGPGGMLECHEMELDRMAGDNYQKRESCKMLAWAKPKAARRRLIQEVVQIGNEFAIILLFRAKDSAKPIKRDGKTVIESQGWMPIGAEEFLFEATLGCVLYPGSNGVPTWKSDFKGESQFMKRPQQFMEIAGDGKRLSVEMGRQMAEWAMGKSLKAPASNPPPLSEPPDLKAIESAGDAAAAGGTAKLREWWTPLPQTTKDQLKGRLDDWKVKAAVVQPPG